MTHQVIRDARVWVAEFDFSGHVNSTALDYSADAPEDTAYDDTARSRLAGGLQAITLQVEGLWEAGGSGPDDALSGDLALADTPVSICTVAGAAEGDRAFAFRALFADYQPVGGAIGDAQRFSAGAEASQGPLVRGVVMHNATRTATGNASAQQLGALAAAANILHAALHVLEVSGTSPALTVKIQSDDNSGFTTPTDRITFTVANGVTSEWKNVAGPITDDWWRVTYTISGTSPSFKFAVVAGIGLAS